MKNNLIISKVNNQKIGKKSPRKTSNIFKIEACKAAIALLQRDDSNNITNVSKAL